VTAPAFRRAARHLQGRPLVLTSTARNASAVHTSKASPRVDFVELAQLLGADLSYPPSVRGLVSTLERRLLHVSVRQAWRARRSRATVLVSLYEGVGTPLALLRPSAPHVLVAHSLTTARRRRLQHLTGFLRRIDRVIVLSSPQLRYLLDDVGLERERVHFLHHNVDHRFFAPQHGRDRGYILSVGREQRDYATLLEAVGTLGVKAIVVGSSAWSGTSGERFAGVPDNVEVRENLSHEELRALYDGASLVVVPLRPNVDYAAGATAVLEAMAMRKAVVVSAAPGIADYVNDRETGCLVPPGDPAALRDAITQLLADRAEAGRLAARARAVIESDRNLDAYVKRLAAIVAELGG
jgi:glycosyltransferase involved in cell wall biosynthesis